MKVDRTARIVFACGAPGCGKSRFLKSELDRLAPSRLLVIDPDGEYEGCGYLHERAADLLAATNFATFKTRLRPSHVRAIAERQFDFVCRLARWHVDPQPGQAAPPARGPLVLVVDELADFVGPSFRETPESWQWIIRRGRKYGVTVLAASQRPAQIDKSIFDLASCIRSGRINGTDSQRAIAAALGVPADEIGGLAGFEYLEREKNTGRLSRGPGRSLKPRA